MFAYAYPMHFGPPEGGWIGVGFRDVPEALTQGRNRLEAIAQGIDALSVALWAYLEEGRAVPAPSVPAEGEVLVEPEPALVMKLALMEIAGGRRGATAVIARALDIGHKEASRFLDPTKMVKTNRLARALELFGYSAACRIELRPAAEGAVLPAVKGKAAVSASRLVRTPEQRSAPAGRAHRSAPAPRGGGKLVHPMIGKSSAKKRTAATGPEKAKLTIGARSGIRRAIKVPVKGGKSGRA